MCICWYTISVFYCTNLCVLLVFEQTMAVNELKDMEFFNSTGGSYVATFLQIRELQKKKTNFLLILMSCNPITISLSCGDQTKKMLIVHTVSGISLQGRFCGRRIYGRLVNSVWNNVGLMDKPGGAARNDNSVFLFDLYPTGDNEENQVMCARARARCFRSMCAR